MEVDNREGYVHVAVRVRPRPTRGSRVLKINATRDQASLSIGGHVFQFSHCFEDEDANSDASLAIFEEVGQPIVSSVMDGYNGTILAYGQRGTGKTRTMGDMAGLSHVDEGLSHRMIRAMFDLIEWRQSLAADSPMVYTIGVQYVEVYDEHVFDVLDDASPTARTPSRGHALDDGVSTPSRCPSNVSTPVAEVSVRELPAKGVHLEGATTIQVSSMEECVEVLQKGTSNLRFGSSDRRQPARSHAICRLLLEGHPGRPTEPVDELSALEKALSERFASPEREHSTPGGLAEGDEGGGRGMHAHAGGAPDVSADSEQDDPRTTLERMHHQAARRLSDSMQQAAAAAKRQGSVRAVLTLCDLAVMFILLVSRAHTLIASHQYAQRSSAVISMLSMLSTGKARGSPEPDCAATCA